jgi:outer membrane receptor for ferric coprogen and ferric-rhodotorulic acid
MKVESHFINPVYPQNMSAHTPTSGATTPYLRRSAIACAIAHSLLIMGGVTLYGMPAGAAHAQEASATKTYNIKADTLTAVLAQFGRQAGVLLSYSTEQTNALRSAGLNGIHNTASALRDILSGTGLQAQPQQNGGYIIAPAAASGADGKEAVLPAVNVVAGSNVQFNNATEGTGTYTLRGKSRTATPLNLSLRETPQTISVITRQRIDDQALQDVKQVITATPGLVIQDMGSDRYTILSRGYPIHDIQIDGLSTYSDVTTQETPQNYADLAIYDRVETLRGASGLMTGAGEPSGTVNLIRKRPTDTFQGSVSVAAGSWSKYRTEVDLSGPLNTTGTVRGRLIGVHQDNHSYIDYMHQKRSVLYGIVEVDLTPNTLLTAGIDYQHRKYLGSVTNIGMPLYYSNGQQITNLPRSFNSGARNNVYESDSLNVFASLEHRLANQWTLKLSANRLQHEGNFDTRGAATWSGFTNPTTGNGMTIYEWIGTSSQFQNSFDANASGTFNLFGREHELSIGGNYLNYSNRTHYDVLASHGAFNPYTWDGVATPLPLPQPPRDSDTVWTQKGLYSAARFHPTDNLHIIAGLRWNAFSTTYNLRRPTTSTMEIASHNGKFIPYFGVVYDLTKQHTVYASYTTIYRPEKYRDREGNYLEPREGLNYEAGIKSEFANGLVNTTAAVYHLIQDNLAEADGNYLVPGTTSAAYRAVKGAKTTGVEFEVNGQLLTGWQVSASYAYSRTEDNQGKRIKTIMPEHMAKLWTTYRPNVLDNKLTVGAGVRWQSEIYYSFKPWQLSGITANARQASYMTTDMMFKYDISKQLVATLNINNVFDKHYLNSIDTVYNTGFYGAPRSINLNMRYNF